MHVHERNTEKKRLNGLMLKSPMKVYRAYGEIGKEVDGSVEERRLEQVRPQALVPRRDQFVEVRLRPVLEAGGAVDVGAAALRLRRAEESELH